MKKNQVPGSKATSQLTLRARDLRKQMTSSELVLWAQLKGRRLHGRKFRRQHPLGLFVVDFFCSACHLVIELDGSIHEDMIERDNERTQMLAHLGCRVIRFSNDEILYEMEKVLCEIERVCCEQENGTWLCRESETAYLLATRALCVVVSPSPVQRTM